MLLTNFCRASSSARRSQISEAQISRTKQTKDSGASVETSSIRISNDERLVWASATFWQAPRKVRHEMGFCSSRCNTFGIFSQTWPTFRPLPSLTSSAFAISHSDFGHNRKPKSQVKGTRSVRVSLFERLREPWDEGVKYSRRSRGSFFCSFIHDGCP